MGVSHDALPRPEWRMVGTLVPILLSWMKAVTDFLMNCLEEGLL